MNSSVVAIVGRPNVGKSTLFNRLLSRGEALTDPQPGTTRDRLIATLHLGKKYWTLVDTGGIVRGEKSVLASQIQRQVKRAIEEAGLLLFVVDLKEGLVPQDEEIADLLRRSNRPILLIANKADNKRLTADSFEFYRLGFGDPWVVSSLHGFGIQSLKRAISKKLEGEQAQEEGSAVRIAIIGRPNVGKSSFVNCLLEEERVLVDDAAGTTRDAVDVSFRKGDHRFVLVDTAGIRREVRLKDPLMLKGMRLSKETVQRSDLCFVLTDAPAGLLGEDLRILQFVLESKKGLVLLINKWDLLKESSVKDYEQMLRHRAPFLSLVPILMTSCVTGKNVLKALDLAVDVHTHFQSLFETSRLNKILEEIRETAHLPGEAKVPFQYMTQIGTRPPHFLIFGKEPKEVPRRLVQFLERSLRRSLPLEGVPIELSFRGKEKRRP